MSSKDVEQSKEVVYAYLQELAYRDPSDKVPDIFYGLLGERICLESGRQDVLRALTVVINGDDFTGKEGFHFLNRCYHSISNPWHLNGARTPQLRELISRMAQVPEPRAINPETRKLQQQLYTFSRNEYGQTLQRQLQLDRKDTQREVVGDLLPELFFLHRSVTRTDDIEAWEQQQYNDPLDSGLGRKQAKKLKQQYLDLGEYCRQRKLDMTLAVNPTHLPQEELEQSLPYYHYKRPRSFDRQARELRSQIQPTQCFGHCQGTIKDYLMGAIAPLPRSVRRKFERDLSRVLRSTDGSAKMAESTIISIFKRLLNAVLMQKQDASNIIRLKRSLESAGAMKITGVLLSLVLACPMIRFHLEKQLGYVYKYFEGQLIEKVQWVVRFFEHVNLALLVNAKKLGYFSLGLINQGMTSIESV